MLRDGLNDAFSGEHSGWHTEDLVKSRQITRDAQDRWAERSQKRFSAAQAAGKFKDEITPVELKSRKGPKVFDKDEHNRPDTTLEEPRQASSGLPQGRNDNGRQCARAEQRRLGDDRCGARLGRTAQSLSRWRGWCRTALAPWSLACSGSVRYRLSARRSIARGWKIGDIERIEINEAFAAIAIAVTRELGLAEDIVNVEGGAIAHGHPIGATGAVLTTRLLHSMKRDGIERGVVTLCIGGGQGIAFVLEAMH